MEGFSGACGLWFCSPELWVLFDLGLALPGPWGSLWAVSKVESSSRGRASPASPSGVCPAGGIQWRLRSMVLLF